MKRISLFTTTLAVLLCSAGSLRAQEMHTHQHEHTGQLGRVNFTVSCSPQAQKQFNRAVAWLHSFEYEEAEKAFTEVTVTDPRCAMGHWGVAMSNYHPLWALPTAAELQKGLSAVEKAKSAGAPHSARARLHRGAWKFFTKTQTVSIIGHARSHTATR